MPQPTNLKRRLGAGDTAFGSFAFLPSPDIVEIMGRAGFDFVIIDLEHSPKSWDTVVNMVRAAELHGMAPLIRIGENSPRAILQAIEIGAAGIVVPFIRTADDVKAAVSAMNYPPRGQRNSCTLTRAADYGGLRSEFLRHAERQNENLVLVAQIEDRKGVDNIESILDCDPGIDAFIIGRSDLASSLGRPGQTDDAEVIEMTNRLIDVARDHPRAVPSGIGLYTPQEASNWIDRGCRLFFYSADTGMLTNSARAAAAAFAEAVESSSATRSAAQ